MARNVEETTEQTREVGNIVLEGVQIKFRNLRGEAGKYNRVGERSFSVVLPNEEFSKKLKEDGWNVKTYEKSDEEIEYTLPVSVAFYNSKGERVKRPPRIYLLADGVKTELSEEDLDHGVVDYADIQEVAMTIRPYVWEVRNDTGVKAYLKNMYVTVNVDKLDQKFAHYGEASDEDDDDEIPFDV